MELPMKSLPSISLISLMATVSLVTISASAQISGGDRGAVYLNLAPGEVTEAMDTGALPLKVVFQSESGVSYPGVYTRVFNASGVAVFSQMCEKPWLFLNLPEGDYHVIGVDRDHKITRMRAFRVGPEGSRQKTITLVWPRSSVGY